MLDILRRDVYKRQTNITSVEDVAGRLGLMKMDQSQLTYIRLDSDSVLEMCIRDRIWPASAP